MRNPPQGHHFAEQEIIRRRFLLANERNALRPVTRAKRVDVGTVVDKNTTRMRAVNTREDPKEGGFSDAINADDGCHAARRDGE